MAYLLDADVFIRAKNEHYGFDFCPAFWDWLLRENEAGEVYSIERVRGELKKKGDELSEWAEAHGDGFFLPQDASLEPALRSVSEWANAEDYEQAAVNAFLQVADYYLVAQALAGRHTVVTHEAAAESRRRIKIPNACHGLNVSCVAPHEMLRSRDARFVLGSAPAPAAQRRSDRPRRPRT